MGKLIRSHQLHRSSDNKMKLFLPFLILLCGLSEYGRKVDGTSPVIPGTRYRSRLFDRLRSNSLRHCARRCCNTAYCNYWSFGGRRTGDRRKCLFFSQIIGQTDIDGFTSGEKGTPFQDGIPIDGCLLTNTKITNHPIEEVPVVNDYVSCGEICEANPACNFWTFRKKHAHKPGTCLVFATQTPTSTVTDRRAISGPKGCPSVSGLCD